MNDVKSGNVALVADGDKPGMLVVEVGKQQRRKRVKQMRDGHGRLFDKINDALADLRAEGAVEAGAPAIVIVVRQKPRKRRMMW